VNDGKATNKEDFYFDINPPLFEDEFIK